MALKERYDSWSYASANSVTITGNYSHTYFPGMRVVLKQGTVKYFVIVSVVYSSPNTTITLDGGGVYSLVSAPITAHIDSTDAFPKNFPDTLLLAAPTHLGMCPATGTPTGKILSDGMTWVDPGEGDIPAPTAENDVLMGNGTPFGSWLVKTIAQLKAALGLGSAAYTASGDYAVAAKGVTNGDSHDHNGGDGAQVAYGSLSGTPSIPSGANLSGGSETLGGSAANGSAGTFARSDHKHAITAPAFFNKLAVTVGVGNCDYVTDGTDDQVQIQAAIDACYATASGPKTVLLLNQEYNLGNATITIKPGIELVGPIIPNVDMDGGRGYVAGCCASINATSVTYSAVTMQPGAVLKKVRFDYPNQNTSSVIAYPATIVGAPIWAGGCIAGILIEDVTGCMPYNFIDFSTGITGVGYYADISINRIRGDPLVSGVKIDHCGHVAYCNDVQFVPGFGGRYSSTHGPLLNYMMDHLVAFSIVDNLAGYLRDCKVWICNQGYVIDSNLFELHDCMCETGPTPLILNGNYCSVIGGEFISGKVYWISGTTYETTYPANWSAVTVTGDMNKVTSIRALGSHHGIYIANGAFRTSVFGNCVEGAGLSEDENYKAGIWDEGTQSTVTGNTIGNFGVDHHDDPTTGIFVNGTDCVISANTIIRDEWNNSWGDIIVWATEVRCVVDGMSRNDGNPASTGNWYGKRRTGVIVYDYTNDKRYIDVSQYGNSPAWKEI
jgi:hypothetical protein